MKSDKMSVTFDVAVVEDLPIELKGQPKAKHKESLQRAKLFSKYGLEVLRIKATSLAALGDTANKVGIRAIGHGKVMVASEYAEEAISALNKLVDQLLKSDKPNKEEIIIDLLKLVREFNKQLLQSAEVHFNADKQPIIVDKSQHLTMPFPKGTALVIDTPNGKVTPST